jgi:integrase
MAKHVISDRTIKALLKGNVPDAVTPDQYGRCELIDVSLPGFGVRWNGKSTITFLAFARFGDSKYPVRRTIGIYGSETDRDAQVFTLEDARAEAKRWLQLARKDRDPREERRREQERAEKARQRKEGNTFGGVAEQFFKIKLSQERKGWEVERDIRKNFFDAWANKPISEIEQEDLIEILDKVRDGGSPYQAYNLLGYARRLFDWATRIKKYGLDKSPCDRLRPKDLGLKKRARQRVLKPHELAVFWKASETMAYPYGPLFQILALTGQRKSDIAECRWSEIDLKERVLTIPAERFKSDMDHAVPLSEPVVQILKSLPRFKTDDYVFSTTFGAKPVNGFSKAKVQLDKAMLVELRKADAKAKLEPFTIHDLRRTMRSGLSALPIEQHVRELVIGHTQQGLHKVYDRHSYEKEKRHALDLWAGRLMPMVTMPPANVVALARH